VIFPRKTKAIDEATPPFVEGPCIAMLSLDGAPRLKQPIYARHKGVRWYIHRLSYHLNVVAIPNSPTGGTYRVKEGLCLHRCDNEWCINPDHLYIGTQQQNMDDLAARNPAAIEARIAHGKSFKARWADSDWRKMMEAERSARAARDPNYRAHLRRISENQVRDRNGKFAGNKS